MNCKKCFPTHSKQRYVYIYTQKSLLTLQRARFCVNYFASTILRQLFCVNYFASTILRQLFCVNYFASNIVHDFASQMKLSSEPKDSTSCTYIT
jgi:hypothetical protein